MFYGVLFCVVANSIATGCRYHLYIYIYLFDDRILSGCKSWLLQVPLYISLIRFCVVANPIAICCRYHQCICLMIWFCVVANPGCYRYHLYISLMIWFCVVANPIAICCRYHQNICLMIWFCVLWCDLHFLWFGKFLLLLLVFNCDLPQCCDNFGLCLFCMLEAWPLPPSGLGLELGLASCGIMLHWAQVKKCIWG